MVASELKSGRAASTEELARQVDQIVDKYRGQSSSLIQALHQAQEVVGYCPKWLQVKVAEGLGVSLQDVYGVVTFYAFFSLIPTGRNKISICAGTACYVKGANLLTRKIGDIYGIKPGQTTTDSRYTLELVRCIGACGLAPAMIVNGTDVHGRLDPEEISGILEKYE